MKLPREVGPIHFIGVGGIGMSGIAEVMVTLGYKVQGTDISDNYNVARLRKLARQWKPTAEALYAISLTQLSALQKRVRRRAA